MTPTEATDPEGPTAPGPLSLTEALIPVASLIVLISLSFFSYGDAGALGPNQIALVVATMIAVAIGRRRGHTLERLGAAAVASVSSGIGAIFIHFAVGSLIGTWALSGTLIAMVYYGLQILSPNNFYLTAAVLCGVVALSIGSSWTVVGTIGIGLMGIAANMGLSPAVTAGAVISGAYFGDESSPLSDSVNLAAAAAGVDLYQHVRETFITSLVTLPLALLKGVWLALASGYKSSTGDPAIDQLISRGGMQSMLNTIWLIITALSFGGVVEKVGVLDRLITPIVDAAKSASAGWRP